MISIKVGLIGSIVINTMAYLILELKDFFLIKKIKNIVNTEDKKRLLGSFFSLSVLQVFTYILPLITFPYLVKVLGVDKFGLVMFAQAFLMFFNILTDYGFDLSATREVSIHRDNKEKLTEIYGSVISIKTILIFVSFIILTIVVFSFEKFSSDWELYYLSFLLVIGSAMSPIWYFQGMEQMKYITIVSIASKLLFTILIFVVIQEPSDYIYVPLLNGFGFIFGGVVSLWIIYKKFKQPFVFQKFNTLIIHFKDSSQFFLSRVSVTIYTSANAFVLGIFTNNEMVGYYSIAEKLYQALQSIYHPIVRTVYPYFSKNKNLNMYKKLFFSIVTFHMIAFMIVFNFSKELIDLLFNLQGDEVINVFTLFLFSSILHIPAIFLGYPFLAAFGYPKYANITVVYGSLFHIVGLISLALFNYINIYSVSSMVILTESVVFFTRIHYVRKVNLIFKKIL